MKDFIVSFLMILAMFIGIASWICFFVSIPLAFIFEWGIYVLFGSIVGVFASLAIELVAMMIDEV
jgi:hypothetical protein